MISGPLQFMPGIRARHPRFHKLNGRIYIASAYIVGISALVLSFVLSPIGGINQAAATILAEIWINYTRVSPSSFSQVL
jgi:hypothetical protein